MRKLTRFLAPGDLSEEDLFSESFEEKANLLSEILRRMPTNHYFEAFTSTKKEGTQRLQRYVNFLKTTGINIGRDVNCEYGFEIAIKGDKKMPDYEWELRIFRRREVSRLAVEVVVNTH